MTTHAPAPAVATRQRATILALAILLLLFALLSFVIRSPELRRWDAEVSRVVQRTENPVFTSVSEGLYHLGSATGLWVLMAPCGLYLWRTRRPVGAAFQASSILGHLLDSAIKMPFDRPRPSISDRVQVLLPADGSSFPSGHAMAAVMFFGFFAVLIARDVASRMWRRVGIGVCAAIVLLIGVSRIYLGDHFLSDVAGGYLTGLFFLIVWVYVYRRVSPTEFTTGTQPPMDAEPVALTPL